MSGSRPEALSRTQGQLAASLKTGARKTMHFVSRRRVETAAVKTDSYITNGSYAGEWKADQRDGFGAQTYSNGDKYEGGWHCDQPEGRGTFWKWVSVSGTTSGRKGKGTGNLVKVYEGDFFKGKRHGSGRLYLENGDIYEGTFVAGLREGQGTQRYTDGSIYHGQWFQDKRHGQGILIQANGDRYIGSWALDKKHGPGQFLYMEKSNVYRGEWVEDIAKCGEMSAMTPDERSAGDLPGIAASPLALVAAATAKGSAASLGSLDEYPRATIPPIGLEDAGAVVQGAIEHARLRSTIAAPLELEKGAGASSTSLRSDLFASRGGLGTLYNLDASSLDLSPDEVAQLTAAFRLSDGDASGRIPADIHALLSVLAALGINAGVEDAQALLQDLIDQELEFQVAREAADDGVVDYISFPVFAACMARLRE